MQHLGSMPRNSLKNLLFEKSATLSWNIKKLIRSLSYLPRNSLMVLSTICASVAPSPNSSDAFFATSLRPTSKASKALVTWQCEKFVPRIPQKICHVAETNDLASL